MQRVLFNSTIFGPIHSRRLGTSLGVNLMPNDGKICTFDCLYCEAGFNAQGPGTTGIPSREEVAHDLEAKLKAMKEAGETLDVITFSGNGEPTIHPEFGGVIDDTMRLRDKYYPDVKISVLSNATMLKSPEVDAALRKVDNNILKLDSAVEKTVDLIDRPTQPTYNVKDVIEHLKTYGDNMSIQTMMLRGEHDGKTIDNTTPEEVDALINAYKEVKPHSVMLYSIDRKTPAEHLRKVEKPELDKIADRIRKEAGVEVSVAG